VSLEEVAPELMEKMVVSPRVLAIAMAVLGILGMIGLAHILGYEVRVGADGSVRFQTVVREMTVAVNGVLALDRFLGLLWVQTPGGQIVLLPELARMRPLLTHLESHPSSASDPRARGEVLDEKMPDALPLALLDSSVWRILRTDSLAFWMAAYGVSASVIIFVMFLFFIVTLGSGASRPDGSVRSLSEMLEVMAISLFIPPLAAAPLVAFRVSIWRAILQGGAPQPGRIEGAARTRGELLVKFSYRLAGEGLRAKVLVRPTAEAKALRVGAPAVILVRQDRPRQALPQALFARRGEASSERGKQV
jgi:hypothetical protein